MSLAGYQPETRVITINARKQQSFVVRGLNFQDCAVLIREHFPDLDAVFSLFDGAEKMDAEQSKALALTIVSQFPGLAANVIAVAAGEGSASDAEKLPAPVQVQALLDIGDLTFTEVGGVKKFVENIAALLTKTNAKGTLTKLRNGR